MTLAIRFYSPVAKMLAANGRSWPVSAGGTVDVPYADAVAIVDQATKLMVIGTTADRPVNDGRGDWPPREMYDTTLAAPVFLVPGSNPARWVGIDGTAA